MLHLSECVKKFVNKNIAVIGDIMLDKYIFGKVDRISPEAPVQIVQVKEEKYAAGGAANAANNIVTLGGNSYLFGVAGNDSAKDILLDILHKNKINSDGVIIENGRHTTQKIRVIGQSQQLLRIDYETENYSNNYPQLMTKLKSLNFVHAVIISDYAKGTITPNSIKEIIEHSNKCNIPILVDPKPGHKQFYKNASLITPNRKEAEELSGICFETNADIEIAGKKLSKELNSNILITLSEKGMMLFEKNKPSLYIPAKVKEVYDVSGAGDTVIATLALCLSSGVYLDKACIIANCAGGIKVGKFGTATVNAEELINELEKKE